MTTTDINVDSAPSNAGRSLWHNRDFLKFWGGETLSLLGTQVTELALPLTAIYAFAASDEQVGILRFLQLAPYLGFALLFGVWVDRARRRPVMIGANVTRMVLLTLIPVLYWQGALGMPVLLMVSFAVGIASVLFDVSWMAFVPTVVRDSRYYVEANSKMGISSSSAEVAGPGLAGVLIVALTAPVALIVDAISYLVSVVSLLMIRTEEPKPVQPTEDRHLLEELLDGLRWVFSRPILRALALVGFCCNFSLVTVWTMFLLYAARDLNLGSTIIGGILAIASIGGLIGAAVSRTIIARFRLGTVYFVAQSALLLGPVIIAFAAGPPSVMIATFVCAFFTSYLGLGVAGVVIVSLRQTDTPQFMMGRMTAVFRTLLFGGGALGGLAAGFLAGAVGARSALVVAAAGSAAVVVALLFSPVTRLRRLPDPVTATAEQSDNVRKTRGPKHAALKPARRSRRSAALDVPNRPHANVTTAPTASDRQITKAFDMNHPADFEPFLSMWDADPISDAMDAVVERVRDLSAGRPLDALTELRWIELVVEGELYGAVDCALRAGSTWLEIGHELDMASQLVQQRFARGLVEPPRRLGTCVDRGE